MGSKRSNERNPEEKWHVGEVLTLEQLREGLPQEVFRNLAMVIEAARRRKERLLDVGPEKTCS